MRVVHVIESLRPGGKERQLVELLNGLSARGEVQSEVVVMSDDIHYDISDIAHVRFWAIRRRNRRDMNIWLRLNHILRELQPDVVHSWGTMCTLYALPAAKLMGIPFIDGVIRDAPSGLTWLDKDYRRTRLSFPLSDAVVGNSLAGLKAYRAPRNKSLCIYNGFDLSRIKTLRPPQEMREALGVRAPFVVGMVASFSHRKDFATFFNAAKRIMAERNDVAFVAVGDGERLERYRALYPADRFPNLHLLGRRKDVEDIVNLFDVGILTTNLRRHGEGLANAVMEYMALGKPVIATDSGGARELIQEGRTGYLIADRDVQALTTTLNTLLNDRKLAARLGASGRQRILKDFSREAMTSRYVDLYRALAERRPLSTVDGSPVTPMRISVFLQDFHGGGAERVAVTLANGLMRAGEDVEVAVVKNIGPYRDDLEPGVRRVVLRGKRRLAQLASFYGYLRRARPDVVLAHLTLKNVTAGLLAPLFPKTRFIGVEHTDLTDEYPHLKPVSKFYYSLARLAYPRLDMLVCVSQNLADSAIRFMRGRPIKTLVMPNPVISDAIDQKLAAAPQHPWLIAKDKPVFLSVGRLTRQKNFNLLIEAFARARRSIDARLVILGEGEDRAALEDKIQTLKLTDCVDLPGFASNPYAEMKACDVFVLASIWEGLPTVLIEAMHCGAAVVSTLNSTGAVEILGGGRLGRLVPVNNADALAEAMVAALDERPSPEAARRQTRKYHVDSVTERYRELFKSVVLTANRPRR